MRLPFTVFAAILLCGIANPLIGGNAIYFLNSSGRRLTSLNLDFGIATTTAHEIRSSDYRIILSGDGLIDNGKRVAVRSGICRIGRERVSISNVRATLNGKESVSINEAKDGVNLSIALKNPQHSEGPVSCEGFDIIIQ